MRRARSSRAVDGGVSPHDERRNVQPQAPATSKPSERPLAVGVAAAVCIAAVSDLAKCAPGTCTFGWDRVGFHRC